MDVSRKRTKFHESTMRLVESISRGREDQKRKKKIKIFSNGLNNRVEVILHGML